MGGSGRRTPRRGGRAPARPPERRSLLDQTEEAIESIRSRYVEAEKTFFQIGKDLVQLHDPAIWALYDETRFRDFVENQVMSWSTASRFIAVARTYDDEDLVVKLQMERAYQLFRYVKWNPKLRRSAQQLARRNAKIGTEKRRILDIPAVELAEMADAHMRNAKKKKRPKVTRAEAASVERFREDLLESMGLDEATVRIDAKQREIRITLSLDEVLGEY